MNTTLKKAETSTPVHELLENRWSPYVFSNKPITNDDLKAIFEAARWAPSSYNDQPWRYLLATQDQIETYQNIFSCLVEGNQAWAKNAYALAIGIIVKNLSVNDQPNRAALHDLGAASMSLTIEAARRGISVHQMIGIIPDKVRTTFNLPDTVEAYTALAVGYLGNESDYQNAETFLKDRDQTERNRKSIEQIVFHNNLDNPFKF
ncbi:nitroreductase family protein [Thiotrichales bacterium 19S3-7]|nr:nitroreductase family protein [Thiotrichales bacterium 19S3-7]MCF6803092.1 nitroreductase family protein [Thiotrichales bacterium 19S3-11]